MPTKLLSPRGKPITQFDRHRHRRSGTTWPAPSVRPSRGCPRCGQRPTRGLLACVVPGARLSLNLTAAPCTVPAPEPARRTRLTALPSLCAERRPCRLTWSRRLLPDRHHLRGAKLRRPGHAGRALCHQRRPNRASSTLSSRQCTPPAFLLLTPSRILSLLRRLELRGEFAATLD